MQVAIYTMLLNQKKKKNEEKNRNAKSDLQFIPESDES